MSFLDFKGNHKQICELKNLINNEKSGVALITGDSSTGKSSIFHLLKNEKKYDILFVDDTNFSDTMLQNFIESRTIENFFKRMKKIVFIDDVDTINIGKQSLSNFQQWKEKVLILITIKIREEKKFKNMWKKIIDTTIYLNRLNYKDCFQVVLNKVSDRDDIETDKLLELVKTQNCNISQILMQIDTATDKWNDIGCFKNNIDIFHDNIYATVGDIYHEKLSNEYISTLCSKDSSVISSIVHENIINLKTNVDAFIEIYDVFTHCDILDKHIYVSCSWGTNWNMLNMYRFTSLNNLINKEHGLLKSFTINFTQQFTKLSSQVGMKKKLLSLPKPFQTHLFDVLNYFSINDVKSFHVDAVYNKVIKDLIIKYKKDFDILEPVSEDKDKEKKKETNEKTKKTKKVETRNSKN